MQMPITQKCRRLVNVATVMQLVVSMLAVSAANAQNSEDWIQLYNGSDLSGWQQVAGQADYVADGDSIVGYSVADSPNSFLATTTEYSDFILEYEALIEAGLNSGVQVRSELAAENYVYGYQVEIETTPRRFAGGIYDERRRGWLYPLSRNEKGRDAFRNGEWNHFRVEFVGNSLRVWVNGIQTSDLADSVTPTGFIALQVHSINDDALIGKTVRWRNIRILTDNIARHRTQPDPEVAQINYMVNKLTEQEVRRGWRLLWDGETSTGWKGANSDYFPEAGWSINDGVLTVNKPGEVASARPEDIVTVDSFGNFELQFEYRITAGANSGVKYFINPNPESASLSTIGCEFQVLDDRLHPDAAMGVGGNRTNGSLYDLITAENLSVPGRGKQFKGVDRWNHGRIVSQNRRVEHWLNHEKVVEYDRHSQIFRALVAKSKYEVWPDFCQGPEGRILLQDHSDTVSYRSIKVRER